VGAGGARRAGANPGQTIVSGAGGRCPSEPVVSYHSRRSVATNLARHAAPAGGAQSRGLPLDDGV